MELWERADVSSWGEKIGYGKKRNINLKSEEKKPFHCNWIKPKSFVLCRKENNEIFLKNKMQGVRQNNEKAFSQRLQFL